MPSCVGDGDFLNVGDVNFLYVGDDDYLRVAVEGTEMSAALLELARMRTGYNTH